MDPCLEYKKILNEVNQHQARVVAVSKLQPVDKIRDLYECGQRDFAENYVQEALEKKELLQNLRDIRWHFIGRLQRNKVKFVIGNFLYIHSVDSYSLAEKISQEAMVKNLKQKIFLQINLSEEKTKGGFLKSDFAEQFSRIKILPHIEVAGLMTMPPLSDEGEAARPFFKELKALALSYQLSELSMGTSHDFSIALQEGATMIRIGTRLFGDRIDKG